MKKFLGGALVLIATLVAYCSLTGSVTRNYKFTLRAEVDGHKVMSSGVVEMSIERGPGGMGGGHRVRPGRGARPILTLDGLGHIVCCPLLMPSHRYTGPHEMLGSLTGASIWPPPHGFKNEFTSQESWPPLAWIPQSENIAYSLNYRRLGELTNHRAKLVAVTVEETLESVVLTHSDPPSWLTKLRNGEPIPIFQEPQFVNQRLHAIKTVAGIESGSAK